MSMIINDAPPPAPPAAARPLGIDAARVEFDLPQLEVLKPDWNAIIGNFVHVRLTVSYWRGRDRISLADLGLEQADAEYQEMARERLLLGHFQLLPPELLARCHTLEQTARNACDKYGCKSPWQGWLIRRKDFLKWKAAVDAARGEFLAVVEEIVHRRDEWLADTLTATAPQALQAFVTRYRVSADAAPLHPDYPGAMREFRARIALAVPTADEIRAKSYFGYLPSLVEAPALQEAGDVERLERQKTSLAAEVEALGHRFASEASRLASNEEWTLSQARIQAERDRLENETAIARAIQERAGEVRLREFETAMTEVAGKAYEVMGTVAFGILRRLKLKEGEAVPKIHPGQVDALRALVEELRAWNVMGDARLDGIVAEVRAALPDTGWTMDREEALTLADDLWVVAKGALAGLGRTARPAGKLTPAEETFALAPLTGSRLRQAAARFEPEPGPAVTGGSRRARPAL